MSNVLILTRVGKEGKDFAYFVFISIFNDRSFGAAMANREMHQNPHMPFKRWQINYPLSDSVTVRVFLTIARAIRLG